MTDLPGNESSNRLSHGGGSGRHDAAGRDRGSGRDDGRREVLTIVGPTAVGKTAVAIAVAERLGGQIVSADSRQIFRGMDIGTAKPTAAERARVPHHMIDIVDPTDAYDASRFAADAESVIGRLIEDGIEPIVVGGTGFYLASLFEGLFEGVGRDDDARDQLRARLERDGPVALHWELAEIDPQAAERIHPNDAARIVRALEVYHSTGRPLSEWHRRGTRAPAYRARYTALTMDRGALVVRIERRVDAMMEAGLLEEARGLVAAGLLREGTQAASAVGYRELLPLVTGAGNIDPDALAAAVERIKTSTRRYAKRQVTWFSQLPGISWIDVGDLDLEGAAGEVMDRWGKAA
jgi:tRNA dimethylallyltransferase